MSAGDAPRPVRFLGDRLTSPPLTAAGRRTAGGLQEGDAIAFPRSRPMPTIGDRCHELRFDDARHSWRVVYRVDPDAIVVVDVFSKATRRTPGPVLERYRRRLAEYDRGRGGEA